MALVYADRVKETTTSTGTGTINLAGAATGFQTFVAGIGNGNTVKYCITDGTDWEVGEGTVTDGTPDTLSRTTIHSSSNAGSAVNWGAGTKDVFCTLPAADFPAAGGGGACNLIQTQTVTSSVTSVDFETGIYSTYETYVLVVSGSKVTAGSAGLRLVYSTNGGGSYFNTLYRHEKRFLSTSTTHSAAAGSESSATVTLGQGATTYTNSLHNAVLTLYSPASTGYKGFEIRSVSHDEDSTESQGLHMFGTFNTTSAIDAIRIETTGTAITGGTFSLYGVST